uniref:Uncharacterized protein n=1 Tax=Moniliophthora roreri TaxID=221103 RepID=A0A0W0G573_MONRR
MLAVMTGIGWRWKMSWSPELCLNPAVILDATRCADVGLGLAEVD